MIVCKFLSLGFIQLLLFLFLIRALGFQCFFFPNFASLMDWTSLLLEEKSCLDVSAECLVQCYLILCCFWIYFTALQSGSFMEVLKEVAKEGSAARDGVAIRADQKSYSYKQLISSARTISSLLSGADLNAVSFKFTFRTSHKFLEWTD